MNSERPNRGPNPLWRFFEHQPRTVALTLLVAVLALSATIVFGVLPYFHPSPSASTTTSPVAGLTEENTSAPTAPSSAGTSGRIKVSGEAINAPTRVGLNEWDLSRPGFSAGSTFYISYAWTLYRANGKANTDDNCQMIATITGPGTLPSPYRSAECSLNPNAVSDWTSDSFAVPGPGAYTLTVVNQLTGMSGKVVFTAVD
jgi:hypothetical protein